MIFEAANPEPVQIFADVVRMLAVFAFLLAIWWTKDCNGISGKAQLLYAIAVTVQYTAFDIDSVYALIIRAWFISSAYCTVLTIFIFFRKTYNSREDSFRILSLIFSCAVVSLLINHGFTISKVLWAFGTYLEAISILPQLYLIPKSRRSGNIIVFYVAAMFFYKLAYMFLWVKKYCATGRYDNIALAAAAVQILIYLDSPLWDDFSSVNKEEKNEKSNPNCVYTIAVQPTSLPNSDQVYLSRKENVSNMDESQQSKETSDSLPSYC